MKGAAISALCSLVCAGALFGQQAEISVAEQQDLMRALSDGNTSPPDLIRALEAHLAKYPNTPQRSEVERSLAKAAVESNDLPRIVKYGESVAAASSGEQTRPSTPSAFACRARSATRSATPIR